MIKLHRIKYTDKTHVRRDQWIPIKDYVYKNTAGF